MHNKTSNVSDLRTVLFTIEPKIDLIHELFGWGLHAELTCTSDGFIMARDIGDTGFNRFLGHPSDIALSRTRRNLEELRLYDEEHMTCYAARVVNRLEELGIEL